MIPNVKNFNEQAYLTANPDVKRSVAAGHYKSGKAHYEAHGYNEDRRGLLPDDFNEIDYLRRNPSVKSLLELGEVPSGAFHYALFGKDRGLSYQKPCLRRQAVIEKLWHGRDPFVNFPAAAYPVDKRGWNSTHAYLSEAISDIMPKIVIEIGVWKGGSSMTMARRMRELRMDSVVISVDTWLGSSEHWLILDQFVDLGFESGYPRLFHRFASNVVSEGLQEFIIPLPLDSTNASIVCREKAITPDVVHIDAGHDYASVTSDLKAWWPLVSPGGALIADDYFPGGEGWPEVLAAVDDFYKENRHASFEATAGKALIRKAR